MKKKTIKTKVMFTQQECVLLLDIAVGGKQMDLDALTDELNIPHLKKLTKKDVIRIWDSIVEKLEAGAKAK